MKERRRESRIEVDALVEMTPLAAVGNRLSAQVINVSTHGIKVRFTGQMTGQPRVGDVYRILGGRDRMLCEISHWTSTGSGTDIGFKILHWSDTGELHDVAETQSGSPSSSTGRLSDLSLPGLRTAS